VNCQREISHKRTSGPHREVARAFFTHETLIEFRREREVVRIDSSHERAVIASHCVIRDLSAHDQGPIRTRSFESQKACHEMGLRTSQRTSSRGADELRLILLRTLTGSPSGALSAHCQFKRLALARPVGFLLASPIRRKQRSRCRRSESQVAGRESS
jgi:hypothetical protein